MRIETLRACFLERSYLSFRMRDCGAVGKTLGLLLSTPPPGGRLSGAGSWVWGEAILFPEQMLTCWDGMTGIPHLGWSASSLAGFSRCSLVHSTASVDFDVTGQLGLQPPSVTDTCPRVLPTCSVGRAQSGINKRPLNTTSTSHSSITVSLVLTRRIYHDNVDLLQHSILLAQHRPGLSDHCGTRPKRRRCDIETS